MNEVRLSGVLGEVATRVEDGEEILCSTLFPDLDDQSAHLLIKVRRAPRHVYNTLLQGVPVLLTGRLEFEADGHVYIDVSALRRT